ncbi:MAG: chromate efflux transporter [Bacteroidetes bacterium]|nr:MAG: chromate efflux transporter [Bacteroidota bacterium]
MVTLLDIFREFFRLGLIAFGGPAAHAALMETELVAKKKWVTRQQFLDYLGGVNLIPGPNSTQITMLVGYQLRGFWGMILGGMGFIIPAALITGVIAVFYVRYEHLPGMEIVLNGIKPAILVIIAGAIVKLGKKAIKSFQLAILGAIVVVATLAGLNEVLAIPGAGILGMLYFMARNKGHQGPSKSVFLPLLSIPLAGSVIVSYSATKLFWIFLKIGALLFGSGYVLIAYVNAELVEKLGWITPGQLIDAIAIGQITPGPLISSATFIGFLLDGFQGAAIATMAIVLPSFIFILILYPFIKKLRQSPVSAAFLDSVNVAAVGVMASVFIVLSFEVVTGWKPALIMLLTSLAVWGPLKINTLWIIAGAALAGYLLSFV